MTQTSAAAAPAPRYAVFPVLAFDYYVKDMHTGGRVSDVLDRAAATALCADLNAAAG